MANANAIGSGLGTSFGVAAEPTYGSPQAPTRYLAVDSAPIKINPTFAQGQGLYGGELVPRATDHVRVQSEAAGDIKLNGYFSGLGLLIATLFGTQTSGAPTALSEAAYQQVHAYQTGASGAWGQNLTIQQQEPTVEPNGENNNETWWLNTGVKILQGQFTCTSGSLLQTTFSADVQDRYTVANPLGAPTKPAPLGVYSWKDMTVAVGPYGSEVAVNGARKFTSTIKRTMDTKRFNAGNFTQSGLTPAYAVKSQPVDNGLHDLTVQLDTEYLPNGLQGYFLNQEPVSVIVTFTSSTNINTGTNPYSLSFAYPACFLIDGDPTVDGPDLLKPTIDLAVRFDGTHNPCTITVVSTDTEL